MRRVLLLGVMVLLCLPGGAHAAVDPANNAGCPDVWSRPVDADGPALARSLYCLINAERALNGLHSLAPETRLSNAALGHASDMITRHYYSHVTPEGEGFVGRLRDAGFAGWRRDQLGENLAWGEDDLATPGGAFRAMMLSPSHRANIMRRKFRLVGIAIVFGGPPRGASDAATYAVEFAGRG
jgi:uncharacterized protein YkwD